DGFRRPAIHLSHEVRLPNQRNFEFDFDAPDVPRIKELKVSVPAQHPVRTALLYTRHRFFAPEAGPISGRDARDSAIDAEDLKRNGSREPEPKRTSRLSGLEPMAPWEHAEDVDPRAPNARRGTRPDDLDMPPSPPPPTRRRRLE